VLGVEYYCPRIATLHTKWRGAHVYVVAAYAPTENARAEDKDAFWNQLSEAVTRESGRVVLLGDLNCSQQPGDVVAYQHNNNSQRFKRFVDMHDLVCPQLTETRRACKYWTWKGVRGSRFRGRKVSDVILVTRQHSESVCDNRAVFPEFAGADHRLVRCRFKPMWRNPLAIAVRAPAAAIGKPDTEVERTAAALRRCYDVTVAERPPKPRWRRPWMTQELYVKLKAKNAAHKKFCQSRTAEAREDSWAQRDEYTRAVRRASKAYWEAWAAEIDAAIDCGNDGTAHELLRRQHKPRAVALPVDARRLEGCKKHFQSLLTKRSSNVDGSGLDRGPGIASRPSQPQGPSQACRVVLGARAEANCVSFAMVAQLDDVTRWSDIGRTWGPAHDKKSAQLCGLLSALERTSALTVPPILQIRRGDGCGWIEAGFSSLQFWRESDFLEVDYAELWRSIGRQVVQEGRVVTFVEPVAPGTTWHIMRNEVNLMLRRRHPARFPETRAWRTRRQYRGMESTTEILLTTKCWTP
jgi:hypothetical protein